VKSFYPVQKTSDPEKRALRRVLIVFAAVALTLICWAVSMRMTGNIHPVADRSAFRSGQLSAVQLEQFVTENGIKTIINLRGEHPEERWYQEENAASRRLNVEHIDLGLSASHEPDDQTLKQLIRLMRQAKQPILIHCEAGADRSGLAAALYRFAVSGDKPEIAEKQLSIFYGHFPWLGSRTGAMDRAFRRVMDAPEYFLNGGD
jgi:protein tyrosine phosphatase (PTP) superfamily phosphohydrolase (DUF442 family)